MICGNCGTYCADGTLYCVNCGAKLPNAPTNTYYGTQPGHGMALTAMILGIASFLPFLPLVTSIAAICFGVAARSKGNREGMATAGIVCGIISLVLLALLMILGVALLVGFAGELGEIIGGAINEGAHRPFV